MALILVNSWTRRPTCRQIIWNMPPAAFSVSSKLRMRGSLFARYTLTCLLFDGRSQENWRQMLSDSECTESVRRCDGLSVVAYVRLDGRIFGCVRQHCRAAGHVLQLERSDRTEILDDPFGLRRFVSGALSDADCRHRCTHDGRIL